MADPPTATRITATLSVRDWRQAMAFYQTGFGAFEEFVVPDGGVARLSVDGHPRRPPGRSERPSLGNRAARPLPWRLHHRH